MLQVILEMFDINRGGGMGWLSIILSVIEKDPAIITEVIGLVTKIVAKNPEIVPQIVAVVKSGTPPANA
jgi:hypothetical protein